MAHRPPSPLPKPCPQVTKSRRNHLNTSPCRSLHATKKRGKVANILIGFRPNCELFGICGILIRTDKMTFSLALSSKRVGVSPKFNSCFLSCLYLDGRASAELRQHRKTIWPGAPVARDVAKRESARSGCSKQVKVICLQANV